MKGQSAGEMLVTYGWVAIIMLVIVSMLVYLGVFSVLGWGNIPDVCVFESGILCSSSRLYDNGGELRFQISGTNGYPSRLALTGYLCSAEPINPATGLPYGKAFIAINDPTLQNLLPQDKFEFDGICYNYDGTTAANKGSGYKGLVHLRYEFLGGMPMMHTTIANLQGRVN